METVMQIDLAKLTAGKVRNLSGHERGLDAREVYNLNELDLLEETIDVVFPEDMDAIATSFFQGMFSQSVKSFSSPEDFLSHYRFVASPEMFEQILRGIKRVTMKRGSAFTH